MKFEFNLIRPHQTKFVNSDRRYVLNSGGVGCITGDSLIRLNRCKKGFQTTIEKAYKSWIGLNKNKKNFDHSHITYIRSNIDGKVKLNKVLDIVYSGEKPVYKLTLENGLLLKATIDHKIYTKNGFVQLGDLKDGDLIACDTHKPVKTACKEKKRDLFFDGLHHHPYARYNGKKKKSRIEQHRAIFEANLNGLYLEHFLFIVRNEAARAKELNYVDPKKFVIHHKDGNHFNNNIENLVSMSHEDHKKIHADYGNFGQGEIVYSKVMSIQYIGIEKTYDICCEHPYNNFTANDIIIHNSGKTYSIVLKALKLIIKHPGIFGLIGAQTYPLLRDTTLREFLTLVPQDIIQSYNKTQQHFKFKNGSEIIFRSFDDPNKLKSLNLGFAGIEEMTDVSEEIFKMLRTRMRQKDMPGQIFGATNPGAFGNWVYNTFIDRPIRNSEVIYSVSADNPYLPDMYLNDLKNLKRTNPEYYERMVMGIWGMLEGVIYQLPSEQRLTELPKPKVFNRYIAGVDFGFQHPTAIIVVGVSGDRYYVIREVYRKEMNSIDIQNACKALLHEYDIDMFYCDSSRPEIIDDMIKTGIPASAGIKEVFDGIMAIKGLINSKRLFVSQQCKYTLREFDSYIWDKSNQVKEVPIKVNDDCLDALRYCIYSDLSKISSIGFTVSSTDDRLTSEMDF